MIKDTTDDYLDSSGKPSCSFFEDISSEILDIDREIEYTTSTKNLILYILLMIVKKKKKKKATKTRRLTSTYKWPKKRAPEKKEGLMID